MLHLIAVAIALQASASPSPRTVQQWLPDIGRRPSVAYDQAAAFISENARTNLASGGPLVTLAAIDGRGLVVADVAFGWATPEGGAPADRFWIARLRGQVVGETLEAWADGRDCPAVGHTLEAIDSLPPQSVDVEGLEPREIEVETHSIGYRVSSRILAYQQVTVSGGAKSVAGPVVAQALDALKACWVPVKPREA